jgi:uncharacterized RDD family membrane protein YckC
MAMLVCGRCGSQLIPQDTSCWKCGHALSGDALGQVQAQIAAEDLERTPRYAGFWERVGGSFADDVLLIMVLGGAYFLLRFWGIIDVNNSLTRWILLGIAVVGVWLYFAGMESSSNQATFGKQFAGSRVTDLDGNRITFGQATVRFIICTVVDRIPMGIGLVAYLPIAFTQKRQALHDFVTSTVVLNDG